MVAGLLSRTGLPAAVAIGLGILSFAAGLLEPIASTNHKLALGAFLILFGLLWQAGSTWRFQHDEDQFLRSVFSVYFLAVAFWAGLIALLVWLVFGRSTESTALTGPSSATSEIILAGDDLCQLYIGNELQQTTDLWATRLGMRVLCQANEASARRRSGHWSGIGEIYVTVAVANGEHAMSDRAADDSKRLLEAALESAVKRMGWAERYPKRTLQFLR